jgi:hypothetical protein
MVENSTAMIIKIDGKQVWPSPSFKGIYGYGFEQRDDGHLVYTVMPLDGKGEPVTGNPKVVIDMDGKELDRLIITLSTAKPSAEESPKEKRVRAEIIEALRRLDEIRKETERPE